MNALFWSFQAWSFICNLQKVDAAGKSKNLSMPLVPGNCSNATLGRGGKTIV